MIYAVGSGLDQFVGVNLRLVVSDFDKLGFRINWVWAVDFSLVKWIGRVWVS